jgi:hypothetical protein
VFKGDVELSAVASSFRAFVGEAEHLAETYNKLPDPVDFITAKSTLRNTELVQALESFYQNSQPPVVTYEWPEEDKAKRLKKIEEAKEFMQLRNELMENAERELEFLKANRFNDDTTAYDIAIVHPEIWDEIQDELDRREWFKDVVDK